MNKLQELIEWFRDFKCWLGIHNWGYHIPLEYCINCHIIKNDKVSKARRTIQQAFKKDPYFKNTYAANIALRVLHDKYNVPVKLANKQATDILDLIFGNKK